MRPNVAKLCVLSFILQIPVIINADTLSRICPPPETIAPCTCKHSTKGPVITCIKAGATLTKAISALKGYAVARLNIDGAEFDDAAEDLFKGLHIEDLSISRVELEEPLNPEERYFQGLENSLNTLEISKSFKSKPLSILRVSHLKKLEFLLFTDNEIPEVTKDWFSGGPSIIDSLIFERNGIKSVGGEAFSSLKNLRTFALAGNSLTEVSRSMLPQPASRLITLDLAYNKIKHIPQNFFKDMPALQNVNLNYNSLTALSEAMMFPVWNHLLELNLEGNKILCDDEIKWICTARRVSLTGKCYGPGGTAGKSIMDTC